MFSKRVPIKREAVVPVPYTIDSEVLHTTNRIGEGLISFMLWLKLYANAYWVWGMSLCHECQASLLEKLGSCSGNLQFVSTFIVITFLERVQVSSLSCDSLRTKFWLLAAFVVLKRI